MHGVPRCTIALQWCIAPSVCTKGVVARGQFGAAATESKMSAKLDCCTVRPKDSKLENLTS